MKIITFGILLLSVVSAMADSLTITWEPNTEPDLAGYFVYYGTKIGRMAIALMLAAKRNISFKI